MTNNTVFEYPWSIMHITYHSIDLHACMQFASLGCMYTTNCLTVL